MTFKQQLFDALKRLFSSMKFLTMLAGLVVYLAAKKGVVLNPDDVQGILILFASLIGAQGLNDFGKEKAKVEAANPKPDQINIQNIEAPPLLVAEAERETEPMKR